MGFTANLIAAVIIRLERYRVEIEWERSAAHVVPVSAIRIAATEARRTIDSRLPEECMHECCGRRI